MDFKLGVLLVHGMGDQEAGFAGPMIDELEGWVRRFGGDPRELCFQSAWWAPVLAKRQVDLLRYLADGHDLDWMPLRRFVVQSLGDAIAYQASYRPISKDQISVYKEVHQVIGQAVRELRSRVRGPGAEDGAEAPLVIIAHSLGCHMVSNHVWDVRHAAAGRKPGNPFERMETLAAFVTLGSTIPLFTLSFPNLDPIAVPAPGIEKWFPDARADELAEVTRWLNFYDPDDVLGYPLRPIDPKYAAAVDEDIAVNVGGLLRSWNPTSHTAYWTDNDVTRPVARLLANALRLL